MNQKASIQVHPDGVAVVTLQNPPVNALHPAGVSYFLHVFGCHVHHVLSDIYLMERQKIMM